MMHTTGPDSKSRAEPSGRRRETRVSLGAKCGRFPTTAQQPLMYDVDDENACLRVTTERFRIENSGYSVPYTYRSSGFLPASRAFARPGSGRLAITSPRPQRGALGGGAKARHRRLRGVVPLPAVRPAKVTQPSLVGGRRRPCLPGASARRPGPRARPTSR